MLRGELEAVVSSNHIPAAAVVLLRADQPPRFIFFGNDVAQDTPFRWGSITKTFTALTLMKAAEAANVPLNTPLSDVVEVVSWQNPFGNHPIRLAQLVELSAGMADLTGRAFSDNVAYSLADAMKAHRDSLVARWPPGLAHSYTNATPGLSELAVEALTGKPFEQALQELVLAPLGMAGSGLSKKNELPGGFKADGRTEIPYWNMTFKAFGALNAPIEDMARFVGCLLTDGEYESRKIWSGPLNERLRRPHTGLAARAGLEIGYAAGIYSRVRRGWVWHGHGGDADGYRSRYGVLRGEHVGYAVVINTDNPKALRRMEQLIESELVRGLAKPASVTTVKVEELDGLTGTYRTLVSRFGANPSAEVGVEVAKDSLVFLKGQRRVMLRPMGDNRFSRPEDPLATVAFVEEQGEMYLVGELGSFKRILQ